MVALARDRVRGADVNDASVVRTVSVVGAECTGKTWLCEHLSTRLPGPWVPEYLREFCLHAGRTPTAAEQSDIMAVQLRRERACIDLALASKRAWALFDSSPLVTAAYSIFCFGDDALLQEALVHQRSYASTLLAEPDLPWQADGMLRDGPEVRVRFSALLSDLLATHGIGHERVAGIGKARINSALNALRLRSPDRLQSVQR